MDSPQPLIHSFPRTGFTLIELLIVVMLVAILAAVGLPLYTRYVDRARASEGVTGLGTIRTVLSGLIVRSGSLPAMSAVSPTDARVGMRMEDLSSGHYFSAGAYTVTSPKAAGGSSVSYCIGVDGGAAGNTAPASSNVANVQRSMDEQGTLYENSSCAGASLNP